jgi:metal-responsive CopG/Arc/MetJ family transcriptional regulator
MSFKAVQISLDKELLDRIDARPEVKERGRSAVIREAIGLYLRAKERQAVDDSIVRIYQGEADALLGEIEDLLGTQAWPDE